MTDPIMWLFSWKRVSVGYEFGAELLNVCMRQGIVYSDLRIIYEGEKRRAISLKCASRDADKITRLLAERFIKTEYLAEGGAPRLVRSALERAGLVVGALAAIFLVLFASEFVWGIRVSGNESLTRGEVIEALTESGFSVGTRIRDVNINKLENEILIKSGKLSWISVNIRGTVADVQVREVLSPDNPDSDREEGYPSDLVASFDGQIEQLLIYEGWPAVKVGQAVRRGEVLVSGMRETEDGERFYSSASGEVLARVYQEFSVEIPFEYQLKVDNGKIYREKYINFFGKSIKIIKSSGKIPEFYDIIEDEKVSSFGRDLALPVGLIEREYRGYKLMAAVRSPEEALKLAYDELGETLVEATEGAMILSKTIKTEIRDDAIVLRCEILCIRNIAEKVEIYPENLA